MPRGNTGAQPGRLASHRERADDVLSSAGKRSVSSQRNATAASKAARGKARERSRIAKRIATAVATVIPSAPNVQGNRGKTASGSPWAADSGKTDTAKGS